MRAVLCLLALLLGLSACTTKPIRFDSEETVRAVSYRAPGNHSLTLITVIRTQTGGGGHSALMINASERIIFDPAGSFYLDTVPERHDVLFGITPQVEFIYRSSHARTAWHVKSQTIAVSPQQAQLAYRLALQAGPVQDGACASATSRLLQQIPGFEGITTTLFPAALAKQFAELPGVEESLYFEEDDPDLQTALAQNNAQLATE